MPIQFEHVHLNCSDVGKTVRFFEESFAGKFLWRKKVGEVEISRMAVGGTHMNLYTRAPRVPDPDPAAAVIDHIAFKVDDLERFAAQLKAKGVIFVREPTSVGGGLKIAFIKGPDNLLVEIYEMKE